ncbi:MAG: hypothetical protein KDB00_19795 [Planctomycetales bacterium]|nr:hypothetical protein [Planctomycetales bacterium]
MKTTDRQCSYCNAAISSRVAECPWCGAELSDIEANPMRRRMSLGALITIMTLAALVIWLASLEIPLSSKAR